jgi:diguanylate cyclase (GGDEF)-like protein
LTDLLVTAPFLLLTVLVSRSQSEAPVKEYDRAPRWIDLFIENASPIVYTLALVVLGSMLLRTHFGAGLSALIVAVCVFGVRTITLQMKYMQTQHALRAASRSLEVMSLRDGLTNVANRRSFDQTLRTEWTRSTRSGHPLSLLLVDIDHFKLLNDRFGHPYGDECLIKVAAALQAVVPRANDLLARYGGEEFAAILPETDGAGAWLVAERMQEAIRCLGLENLTPLGNVVTVSIGVAMGIMPLAASPEELIDSADRALYQAKRKGRNRIEQA